MSINSMWIFTAVLIPIITEVYSQKRIPDFDTTKLIQVEKGQYVEIRFRISKPYRVPGAPCADEEYLEIRDGYNQSAKLLGVFCGRKTPDIIRRSSGHNMWLRFSAQQKYRFSNSSYEGKAISETVPANLTKVPQKQFLLFNHSSSLWCQAEGGPAPYIVWRKDGAVEQNSTSVKFQLNITEKDINTKYSCEVDSNGLLKRKNISLIVQSCPEPCQCTVLKGNMRGFMGVDCQRKQLRSIPQSIPRATVKLNLSKNKLKTMSPEIFSNKSWLRYLDLSKNQLKTLPQGVFNNMTWLHRLDLSKNRIKSLPQGVFNQLRRIGRLDLSKNRLQDLRPRLFAGIRVSKHGLLKLDLSKNQLQDLPPRVFAGIRVFKHGLLKLNLSNNQLSNLSSEVFADILMYSYSRLTL